MTRLLVPMMLALAAGSAHAQALPSSAPAKPPAAAAKPAQGAPAEAPSPEQIFGEWDTDKNKQLSLAEFKAGVEKARMAELIARLEQQFRKADTSGNKKLEAAEYAQLPVIKRGGPQAPPLATFDANKDQGIDFQEYLAMVQAFLRRSAGAQ